MSEIIDLSQIRMAMTENYVSVQKKEITLRYGYWKLLTPDQRAYIEDNFTIAGRKISLSYDKVEDSDLGGVWRYYYNVTLL